MRIIKVGGGLGIELPSNLVEELDIEEGQEINLIPITKDVVVLVLGKKHRRGELTEDEMKLLKKLNSIKFSERTGKNISKKLTKDEMKLLYSLVKKGVVIYMGKGKYKDQGGVYSITREYFQALRGTKRESRTEKSNEYTDQLKKQGYLILTDQADAESTAMNLSDEIENGEVTALKTFDGKVIFATAELVNTLGGRIINILSKSKRGMSIDTIANKLKVEPDKVRAVIEILRESGDVIEKRKGVYTSA